MARPTKYTPERVEIICDCLSAGSTRRVAYGKAGVDSETFAAWLKRYSDFSEQVTRAEAEAEEKFTSAIFMAATALENPDWRAAESWLKRRRREDWGDKTDVTSNGETIKAYIGFDTEAV